MSVRSLERFLLMYLVEMNTAVIRVVVNAQETLAALALAFSAFGRGSQFPPLIATTVRV